MFDPQNEVARRSQNARTSTNMKAISNFDATYSDWRDVNRAKFPFHIS
jgi:hypothetical protein